MPANKEKDIESLDETDTTEYDEYEEYDDSDYGFIISPEGELKSVMFPEDSMDDPPKEIIKILKIFGIKNIYEMTPRTIH